MALSRLAIFKGKKRPFEVAFIISIVAVTMVFLAPTMRAKALEHAQQEAQAKAWLDNANAAGAKVMRVAPVVVNIMFTAAESTPQELMAKVAPLELEDINDALKEDPNNSQLLLRKAELEEVLKKSPPTTAVR